MADNWLDATAKETPLWLRTFSTALPVTAVFVVHGGIHDLHPITVGDYLRPETTVNALWQVLRESGFQALLTFDPLRGLNVGPLADDTSYETVVKALSYLTDKNVVTRLLRDPAQRAADAGRDQGQEPGFIGMDAIAGAVARASDLAMALVIDYSSQSRDGQGGEVPGMRELMLMSLMLANAHATLDGRPVRFSNPTGKGQLRHPIIWLVDKADDLPNWLTHGDGIRQLPIAPPDVDTRQHVARLLVGGQVPSEEIAQTARRFADATEGFTTRGMFEAVQLARAGGSVLSDIEGAVRTYREGLSENPWQSTRLREQLAQGEEVLTRRVKGQDEAVGRVLDILKRSALGLTGAHQRKPSTAPRGVLYFAGPTGVGKTEMAKAVAELVFADERALVRFDMSEFADDHAKIRLVGAPPSYVGYGSGGELTNAVQNRPHSIVLFDEMDKAGREVYDLFLQILSDGRLTDGAGRTALFNEALIIFTSNQGVAAAGDLLNLDMTDPAQAAYYTQSIERAVESHFAQTLGRPELLGRLGDNIVVFRPISGDVAGGLASQFIDAILSNTRIRVGNPVTISDQARRDLIAAVTRPEDLASGGRGITTALEDRLTNPLGRVLFGLDPSKPVHITGLSLDPADGRGTLLVEV